MIKSIFVGLCLSLITGCSLVEGIGSAVPGGVRKGAPVVYIHPLDVEAYVHASVGVPPFVLPENLDKRMGPGISAMFKDVLLGKGAFSRVTLLSEGYGDFDEAFAIGRRAGTDLVLAGKVNYALSGGDLGGARLDVSIRLLNVNTGATVWHIGQVMDQPMLYPDTDTFGLLRNSVLPQSLRGSTGPPALTNMLAQVAGDIASVMKGGGMAHGR